MMVPVRLAPESGPLPSTPPQTSSSPPTCAVPTASAQGWFRSPEVVEAVKGISFTVPRGTVFGMLGPNGAGKTTTIKMLSTLLIPTSGTASVDGFDVVRDEVDVRRRLGVLFGGDKGLYNQLSARENLRYFGRLYGMADEAIERRSDELLEQVGLADRAERAGRELLARHEAAAAHRQDPGAPSRRS